MPIAVSYLGDAVAENVTSLTITTSGNTPAGGQIWVGVCVDLNGFDDIQDSVGNTFQGVAGSQNGSGTFFFRVFNNLRLPNGSQIRIINSIPLSGRLAAFYISGLTSGAILNVSSGQNTDAAPLVAFDNIPSGSYVVALVGVAAGSSNTFTQYPNFTAPGNFNVQNTVGFSSYGGYRQVPGGTVIYNPTLASPAAWNALMVALAP